MHSGYPPFFTTADHVTWQGDPLQQTSPGDILWMQPLQEVMAESPATPWNDMPAACGKLEYPAVCNTPHVTPRCYPPASMMQFLDHTSSQVPDVPQEHPTESSGSIGQMSRGSSSVRCEWVSNDLSMICGQTITEETVSEHLAEHGIRRMHKDYIVQCRWHECGTHIKRQSITRHTREVHLGLGRKSNKRPFVQDVV